MDPSDGSSRSKAREPNEVSTLVSQRDRAVERLLSRRSAPDVVVEGPRRSSSSQPSSTLVTPGTEGDAKRRWRRWLVVLVNVLKIGALVGSALAVVAALVVFLTIRRYEATLPSVDQLKAGYAPPQVTRLLGRDGALLADIFTERRTVISLADIPPHAKLAFLAAEDARFYEHSGLNYLGMLRALIVNLRAGRTVQGGSTITQQVVKNVLLDAERSYDRKMRETILARRLEQNLSKDEIFALYLNHIYFGHRRYGVEEAARFYFGKKAAELDLAEAALLAGIVQAPERHSPRHSAERALERRAYVLDQMLAKGFVTPELYERSKRAPLRLAPDVAVEPELAPEAVAGAKELLDRLAGERARLGGFTVWTTIDPVLQSAARQAVRENLAQYAKRQKLSPPYTLTQRKLWGPPFTGTPKPNRIYVGTVLTTDDKLGTIDIQLGSSVGRVTLSTEERYNPQRLPPSEFTTRGAVLRVGVLPMQDPSGGPLPLRLELGPQSALVAIDVRTRELRALVGSHEALLGGLDRTRARRQPGSAFKPFLYSYALHSRRFAPSNVIEVEDPKAEGGSRRIGLRAAVAKSDNAVASLVLEAVGAANVVAWANAAGIDSKLGATPSLALGAYEVTPLELANAYATFASGGEFAPWHLVSKVTGPDSGLLPLPAQLPARRVMEPEVAYLTTSLLRGVVSMGTGMRAQALGRPVAGKTGTTNDGKDAWFVGYSPELVTAVWVGYDDALPLGTGEQGAATALPAWVEFMKAAHAGRPVTDFPRPSGIVVTKVDPASGLIAYPGQEDAVEEEFLPGTVPNATAEPDAGADAGAEAGSGAEPAGETPAPREIAAVADTSPDSGVPEDEPPPF